MHSRIGSLEPLIDSYRAAFNTDKLSIALFLIQVAILEHQNASSYESCKQCLILLNNNHISPRECLLAELALT